MATTEMAVTVNVADLGITKSLVLASADMLQALENQQVCIDATGKIVYPANPEHWACFERFKAAVLAFADRDERAHIIPVD